MVEGDRPSDLSDWERDMLRRFVDRAEALHLQRAKIDDQLKAIYDEARGVEVSVRLIKQIVQAKMEKAKQAKRTGRLNAIYRREFGLDQ